MQLLFVPRIAGQITLQTGAASAARPADLTQRPARFCTVAAPAYFPLWLRTLSAMLFGTGSYFSKNME